MTDTPAPTPGTYRFPRLPKRGLLLGLSALRVAALAAALLILVPSLFVAGPTGGVLTAPLWGALAVGAFVRRGGQPVVDSLPTVAHYAWRRATGQTSYRIRPDQPRPGGTLALPGDAASLRFHIDETGTAMIHDPHARTLTAVALVTHPAYVLLSPDEQARRVHGWGRALAHLAATGTGTRIQVLEISLPDAGHGITGWWDTHQDPGLAGTWVAAQYEDLMTTVVPAAATHRTLIAVSLDLHAARAQIRRSGRGLAGAAAFLRQEMTSFEAGLRAAELRAHPWLGEPDLAAILRTAYDPAYEQQEHAVARLADAGPVAVDEHWDHLRHDTGHSAVLWISEWPRVPAPAVLPPRPGLPARDPQDPLPHPRTRPRRPGHARHPQGQGRVRHRRRPEGPDRRPRRPVRLRRGQRRPRPRTRPDRRPRRHPLHRPPHRHRARPATSSRPPSPRSPAPPSSAAARPAASTAARRAHSPPPRCPWPGRCPDEPGQRRVLHGARDPAANARPAAAAARRRPLPGQVHR